MKATECGWAWRAALLGILSAVACERPAQDAIEPTGKPGSVVLARVGDEVVTVEDLGWVPARVKPVDRLEMLVTRKLAAREARRRGLAEDPKIRSKLAEIRFNALTWEESLLRNALYNSIRLGLQLNDDELRAHYEKTTQRYIQPQWKFHFRRFESEAEARAAAEALGATGRLDPAQSEELGPVPAETLPVDLLPMLSLFAKPGDRQVVKQPGGWSLFELDEHLPAAPLRFEWVRDQVDRDLRAVRAEAILNDELARLRADQVVIDAAALETVEKEKAEATAKRAADAEAKAAAAAPAEATP